MNNDTQPLTTIIGNDAGEETLRAHGYVQTGPNTWRLVTSAYVGQNEVIGNPELKAAYDEEVRKAMERFQAQQDPEPAKWTVEPQHIHGPFTFIMNQNHNALRGCQSCGAAWVGLMAGLEESLCWHPVAELPEE